MHGSAIRTLSEGAPPPPPPPHHLYHAPPSARPPPHSSPIHRAGVDGTVTGGSRGRGEGGTPYKKLSQAQNHRASVAAAAAAAAYMYALNPGTPGSVETRPYLPSGPPTAAVTRYPPPPPTGPSLVYSTRGDVTSGAPTYLHPPPPHPNPPQRQLPKDMIYQGGSPLKNMGKNREKKDLGDGEEDRMG
ncbi:unnamed protein product [Darwinula stevensoni]|uniref:Uncharacterized protein n=1 Tax=Darwinula stevensoni TaxID=69355 RepID=A0A7R8X0G3_9CRUS|nr:unnamed protein product [Darwinula stevensoni]CAG0878846.1 unnamed protein product [Darwinula stevensoni]